VAKRTDSLNPSLSGELLLLLLLLLLLSESIVAVVDVGRLPHISPTAIATWFASRLGHFSEKVSAGKTVSSNALGCPATSRRPSTAAVATLRGRGSNGFDCFRKKKNYC
jgi:hypothetical protein